MPNVEGGGYFGSAVRAAGEGISASAWLRTLAEAGTGIRRQVGLRLYAEARRVVAEAGEEPSRALSAVPSLAEMAPIATRSSAGVLQTVQVSYREKVTGNIRTVYHTTKSEHGVTREQAITNAISAYAGHAEEYEQTLLGAVHSSAVRMVPVDLGLSA